MRRKARIKKPLSVQIAVQPCYVRMQQHSRIAWGRSSTAVLLQPPYESEVVQLVQSYLLELLGRQIPRRPVAPGVVAQLMPLLSQLPQL